MDLRKLRMLAELRSRGTLAAVAQALHMTAPGVSMQLTALQKELGLQLTQRHGRTLTLTPAGRMVARHAVVIMDAVAAAELEVEGLRDGSRGTYRIAAFPSAARTIVAGAWGTLLHDPDNRLQLQLVEMEPPDSILALQRGDVDLAITHAYSNIPVRIPSTFSAIRIASEPVWLATCTQSGSADAVQPAADLLDYAESDWVVPHQQWACYDMVQRACASAGFAPRTIAEASDFSVLLSLVSAGVGIALVPQLTIAQLPENVALHPLATPVHRHDFVVTRRSTNADPGIRRVSTLLDQTAQRFVSAISPENGHSEHGLTT